jgi:hypothetical protein
LDASFCIGLLHAPLLLFLTRLGGGFITTDARDVVCIVNVPGLFAQQMSIDNILASESPLK